MDIDRRPGQRLRGWTAALVVLAACSGRSDRSGGPALRLSDLPRGYAQTSGQSIDLLDEAPSALSAALRQAGRSSAYSAAFEALPPALRTTVQTLSVLSSTEAGTKALFADRSDLAREIGLVGLSLKEQPIGIGDDARLESTTIDGVSSVGVVFRDDDRVGLVGVHGVSGRGGERVAEQLARALERRLRAA